MRIFFLLMCVHALTDFRLQFGPMHELKKPGNDGWVFWMGAHALICGGGVYAITNSLFLGITETIAHFIIDTWKANDRISFTADQLLHTSYRIIYAIYLTGWPESVIL